MGGVSGWFALVWVVWMLLVVGAVVAGFRWYNRPAHRRLPDLTTGTHAGSRYLGGLRWEGQGGVGNATMPLARLELFDWGVRVAPSVGFLRALVPTWEARYSDLGTADLVKGPFFGSRGVRLRLHHDDRPLVFWTYSDKAILGELAGHGVSVTSTRSKLPWMSNH